MTRKDIDDAAMAGAPLGQITDPIGTFTADGAYDQDQVNQAVAECHPDAAVIVPPRAGAVASASAGTQGCSMLWNGQDFEQVIDARQSGAVAVLAEGAGLA